MTATAGAAVNLVENFRLTAAIAYARRGWRVFPVHGITVGPKGHRCACGRPDCVGRNAGKHPLTPHGFKDATTDWSTLVGWWQRWPNANVAIATGKDSGLFVLDVDSDPEKDGFASLAELCDEYGQLPETAECATGSGGLHVFFAYPGPVSISAGKLGRGLDVRCDGGYVVAAPSLHRSGQRYAWKPGASPDEVPTLAEVPGWLLARLTAPEPKAAAAAQSPAVDVTAAVRRWVDWAVRNAGPGRRSECGHGLAVQLRDGRFPVADAEAGMREYARRVGGSGDHPYTEREALATYRSACKTPPRDPAPDRPMPARTPARPPANGTSRAETGGDPPRPAPPTPAQSAGAADELRAHVEGIASGRIVNVPWPWPQLTKLTCALVPGSVTCVCGDPGVGKTFFVLQCLQFWLDECGVDAAAFFIEKNRTFHTQRLLAQLSGLGSLTDYDWVRANPDKARAAMDRHAADVERIGAHVASMPGEMVSLDTVLGWVRDQARAGKRVIVVDPITAALAGSERWVADDKFVIATQKVMSDHGASLVLIQHPKKGNLNGKQTGYDMGGGAAYHRFTDTTVWLHKPKQPKQVSYHGRFGTAHGRFGLFFQLHKTRNGRGAGGEIAYLFGEGLRYAEQGLVIGDAAHQQVVAPPPPPAPVRHDRPGVAIHQDIDFDEGMP